PEGAVARLGTVRFRHNGQVNAAAFSPDGKTVASGGVDGTVRLWDSATGQELRCLRGHPRVVWSVAFSPDGGILASAGGYANAICIWDANTGKLQRRLEAV